MREIRKEGRKGGITEVKQGRYRDWWMRKEETADRREKKEERKEGETEGRKGGMRELKGGKI